MTEEQADRMISLLNLILESIHQMHDTLKTRG
jgi:hypothetical protein